MPNIIEITDFTAPELDVYARLTEGQLKSRADLAKGLFIAESPNVILRALDGGYEPVSLLMERKHIEGQAREVVERCGDIPLYTAPLSVLTELTGFPLTFALLIATVWFSEGHGIHALTWGVFVSGILQVLSGARRIAVLEDIMNPTNVGAIFRSAAALGMDAVLLTPSCSDPLYRRAVRVSMGTVFQIPWTHIGEELTDWPHPGLETLRALGFKTAAMALREDSVSIDDPALMAEEKLAVVLGTEGEGLADGTIADCDYTVRIPMSHGVDSLNVAAASAVAFWQLSRRREP